ncbi:MAG: gliding motility lipoprotein GldJ [Altibacter sp.]|uniref:gliding motility lipoprotein GldJ n=1 Tax=Altibacter sp. TaxID=2024823 RepID=UPI001DAA0F83|nr:gliding motility lipoprotein GldJ [Altibacter sp.]MBZ0326414.1 gliding motility lipoprotein GldJ [Altibacter sp.]
MNFRKNLALQLFIAVVATSLFISCNKSRDYKNSSRATGWKMNSKEGGFQYNPKAKEQETGPGLVFIEGGTYTMGRVQDDPMHDWNNSPNQQHIQSFYMDETEVTNLMYMEYLDWIKQVFPPSDENYRRIYDGAVPDTLVWRNRLGYNEVMTNNYLRHPAYADYPVVGVSWVQAVEFSNWRTDRVNELILEEEGITTRNARYEVEAGETFSTETYLNSPTLTYGGNDSITRGGKRSESLAKRSKDSTNLYVQRKDGLLMPDYRLPTESEWEYAALGLVGLRSYNVYRGRKKYPWDGQYTRSGKRRSRGDQLANFKQGDGDYGGIAGWSDDGADITAQVKSYEPNDYGLYDMAGNVAEWVADVYRPIVDDEFNDFNYYRGNVYTKNAIDKDGKVKIVTADSIVYDTLSNGKIVARNLPGEILQVPVDEAETYLRTNFSESDNRDYRDGDKRSTRYFSTFGDDSESEVEDSKRMYNSPQHQVFADSTGNLDRQYDKSTKRTTLVDNQVRVYKGGSWRDRDYWLDPAQRRYFPQDMSTDYIGFRCAMSRVGSKSKKGKRPRN